MKYAIIENGIVSNAALANEPLDTNWVPLEDGFGIGDFYSDGVFTKAPYIEPAVEVPQVLTPRQFRLALLQVGLLDDVEAMTAGSREHQIYFEYSLDFERNHPLLVSMASTLGLTDAQIDELFILGGTL